MFAFISNIIGKIKYGIYWGENMRKNKHDDVECGKRLKECRLELGYTQAELAEKIYKLPENKGKERSSNQIGYMERGERTISYEYAALLSQILGVRAEYLRGEDDFKTKAEEDSKRVEKTLRHKFDRYENRGKIEQILELYGYKIIIDDKVKKKKVSLENDIYVRAGEVSVEELADYLVKHENMIVTDNMIEVDDIKPDEFALIIRRTVQHGNNEVSVFDVPVTREELFDFLDSLHEYIGFTINQHFSEKYIKYREKKTHGKHPTAL